MVCRSMWASLSKARLTPRVRPDEGELPLDFHEAIAVEPGEDSVIVSVQDNGIGLPQDRVNILEPYVTTREKGTGLGLAIVNKIVEEHGGEMTFTSVETGGTRVTMRFARDPLAKNGDGQHTG